VGAWGFDETSGATAQDVSGSSNTGSISGAKRVAGKYGGALSFDGVNDMVSVADSNSLDLSKALTLEAWVKPSKLDGMWRTAVIKEQTSQLCYALYAGNKSGKPSGHVYSGGDAALASANAIALSKWTHVATTWDGSTLRMYVNGTQVASSALSGTATTSSRPLRIGGNNVWTEWFNGLIDEVRVYNRALSPDEVKQDRDTPINGQMKAVHGTFKPASRRAVTKRQRVRAGKAHRHQSRWL
jgi:hypothetical protein